MKKALGVVAIIIGLFVALLPVRARASTNFVISEIQLGSAASASEEYIQISNMSASTVDITGWRLEYYSANPKSFSSPSRTIKLSGSVGGRNDYLLASTGYKTDVAQAYFGATLASTGGHLRLVMGNTTEPTVLDQVGWGTAIKPELSAAIAPQLGQILARNVDTSDRYVDTDNNASDFSDDANTPLSSSQSTEIDGVVISELLPNPTSPTSDSVGEFIELLNTTDHVVMLRGSKLLAGSTLSHTFVFKEQQLNPGEYKAFYASDTHIALANNGGKVQLQNSAGVVLSETSSYATATDGQAWAWDGDSWQWSALPTPNSQNSISLIAASPLTKTTKNSTKKTTKKPTVKKSKSAGKVKGAATASATKSAQPEVATAAPLHASVLAGVGSLALLYGVYEYRTDIAIAFRKLRGNRRNRS